MRIAMLKQFNEKIPYWAKVPFSGAIRQKLIGNPVFLETYRELERADAMTPEELDAWQLRQLKEALRHAGEHTAYYRELFRQRGFDPESVSSVADLSALPVLTKEDLKTRFDDMAADDLTDFYPVTTGGTTGTPTKVLMERDAIYREWAFVYHYWSKYGYDYRTSKLATLRGVSMGKTLSAVNPLYREIRLNPFVMNRNNIGEYVKRIGRYQAGFLYGYPSAVHNFCRLTSEKGINLRGRFQAALLISENLYPFQEETITAALGCPIAMFYGHSERAVFAERSEKGYAFHPLYGVTEIAPDGTPIVTGFINRKMPLIRYQVDDYAESVNGDGRFRITGHRNGDLLYGLHGEEISAAALNFHSDVLRRVSAYQYVQSEPGTCVLKVLSDERLNGETLQEIALQVNQKLAGAVHCDMEQAESLYGTGSGRGKYKMVIQRTSTPPPRSIIW